MNFTKFFGLVMPLVFLFLYKNKNIHNHIDNLTCDDLNILDLINRDTSIETCKYDDNVLICRNENDTFIYEDEYKICQYKMFTITKYIENAVNTRLTFEQFLNECQYVKKECFINNKNINKIKNYYERKFKKIWS